MPEPEPKPQPRGQLSELEMMELIYEIEALEESKIYRLETAEEAAERRRKRGLK
jgi:hypothetical protein